MAYDRWLMQPRSRTMVIRVCSQCERKFPTFDRATHGQTCPKCKADPALKAAHLELWRP